MSTPEQRAAWNEATCRYRERHPERSNESARKRREAHPEKQREADRRYREKHPVHVREQNTKNARRLRDENPERVMAARLKRSGFTIPQFDEALALQHHRCAICSTDFASLDPREVHADHDHATGFPRGVLCRACNTGIGLFKDSAERLLAAVRYLEHPTLKPV